MDRLKKLEEEIQKLSGVRVVGHHCDVTSRLEVENRVDDAMQKFGRVDIAICNAGIGQYGPVERSTWEDIGKVVQTNAVGAISVAHAVLPQMKKQRSGSIIFISSVLGKRALQYNAAYCASKYALHGFADALRQEVKQFGVHVGVVCPARTETDFFSNMIYSVPQTRIRNVPTASADDVAREILRAIDKKKREVIVSPGGKLWSFIGVHFPRMMDFILDKSVPKPDDE